MIVTEFNIPCVWGGTLIGILLKNEDATVTNRISLATTKIIGIHGWLDNLNSLLPVATKLIAHRSSMYKNLLKEIKD